MLSTSLRQRILMFVGALVLTSLLGTGFGLYRISKVNEHLDAMNRVSVPLGQLLSRLKWDSDVLEREMNQRLGYASWEAKQFRPKMIPRWIHEVISGEISQAQKLVQNETAWASPSERKRWQSWMQELRRKFTDLELHTAKLYKSLSAGNHQKAEKSYPDWVAALNAWTRQTDWGVTESARFLRRSFRASEEQVNHLKDGMEIIVYAIGVLTLVILLYGERALRPLGDLITLAKDITRRGIQKIDKTRFPRVPLTKTDEVSQLSREFQRMALSLLEREKTVVSQQGRLQKQNSLLKEMIQEQREMQERLQLAENMAAVGRMSAQVAHEVRNPLHSIGLEAEMALEQAKKNGSTQIQHAMLSVLSGVDRLDKITQNYLKMSRLSSGKKEVIDLGVVLQNVLATYAPVCESNKINVDWSTEKNASLKVFGDKDILEQALGNIFRNSIQVLEEVTGEKRITIKIGETESSSVFLKISDSGPGVSIDVQKKLFKPFVTTKAQGTGLGLPFVRNVVENHGGEITYDNSTGGACFILKLPSVSDFETLTNKNLGSQRIEKGNNKSDERNSN